jgi:hypothetical protein
MRVGRGRDEDLDATIVGEAQSADPGASLEAATSGKDMFSSFLARCVIRFAVEEVARPPSGRLILYIFRPTHSHSGCLHWQIVPAFFLGLAHASLQ